MVGPSFCRPYSLFLLPWKQKKTPTISCPLNIKLDRIIHKLGVVALKNT